MSKEIIVVLMRTVAAVLVLAHWVTGIMMVTANTAVWQVVGWMVLGCKVLMLVVTAISLIIRPLLGWRIFCGRYVFDTNRLSVGLGQVCLRYTWELPQFMLGYWVAQVRNIAGNVDRVEYLGGVTYVIQQGRGDWVNMGMSLGAMVNVWLTSGMGRDFEYEVRYSLGQLLMHEYGHTIDSRIWGWLYLPVVGLPSLISVYAEKISRHEHRNLYAERWADKHAQHYFGIKIKDLNQIDKNE